MKSIFIKFINKTQYLISSFYGKIYSYTDRIANKKFYDYPYGKKPHATKEEYFHVCAVNLPVVYSATFPRH